ncbi:hypothetical protein HHK36_017046 [Tetracentron sinense]|uniref:Uncharacterized protein n=1 Tax=Tetracentron sinense TaxID=13715 RepID=A0A834Z6F7_TETSI|nr:hypothetical protein HHK36_017046 [Tetracentron sinense]
MFHQSFVLPSAPASLPSFSGVRALASLVYAPVTLSGSTLYGITLGNTSTLSPLRQPHLRQPWDHLYQLSSLRQYLPSIVLSALSFVTVLSVLSHYRRHRPYRHCPWAIGNPSLILFYL